jgi:toxin HigB-1
MSTQGSLAIEISWSDRRLEEACSSDRVGARRWGPGNWRRLKLRLASLAAAPTLRDMAGVPGNCHQLRADRAGEFAVYLWGSYRLVFEPDHNPLPGLPDGGIDRGRITKIVIKEVVDYHGN